MRPSEVQRYLVFQALPVTQDGEVTWRLLGDVAEDDPDQAARHTIGQNKTLPLGDYELRVVAFDNVTFLGALLSRNVDVR